MEILILGIKYWSIPTTAVWLIINWQVQFVEPWIKEAGERERAVGDASLAIFILSLLKGRAGEWVTPSSVLFSQPPCEVC